MSSGFPPDSVGVVSLVLRSPCTPESLLASSTADGAAGAVVSILPVLALFIGLQRYILPSASGDAVKG